MTDNIIVNKSLIFHRFEQNSLANFREAIVKFS